MKSFGAWLAVAVAWATGLGWSATARAQLPSVDSFPDQNASAPEDAAVVVGIDKYFAVDPVPYAARDAQAFWTFLVNDRGVPANRISLLKDTSGANDRIQSEVKKRAAQVGPGGTLWFFFAGHGAPDPSGKDGLLVGVDAQQTLESVKDRSVSRQWLMDTLSQSPAKHVVVFLDACFSGKGKGGSVLASGLRPLIPTSAVASLPRAVLITGAKSDQVSGPLDAAQHGLFTYFLLGSLRGWGLPSGRGPVKIEDAFAYLKKAMSFALANGDREQEPEVTVAHEAAGLVLAQGLGEKGPDLTKLAAGELSEPAPRAAPPAPSPAPAPEPQPQIPQPQPQPQPQVPQPQAPQAQTATTEQPLYYAGMGTLYYPNGSEFGRHRGYVEILPDSAHNLIKTRELRIYGGSVAPRDDLQTWRYTGTGLALVEATDASRGEATLSGPPWAWTEVRFHLQLQDGSFAWVDEKFYTTGLTREGITRNARGQTLATGKAEMRISTEAEFNQAAASIGRQGATSASAPARTCSGGASWDGSKCACPALSAWSVKQCVCVKGTHATPSGCAR